MSKCLAYLIIEGRVKHLCCGWKVISLNDACVDKKNSQEKKKIRHESEIKDNKWENIIERCCWLGRDKQ